MLIYKTNISTNLIGQIFFTMLISAIPFKSFCFKWVKVFKNGPSKICGTVFKKFEVKNITLNSLKVVSHKLYLVQP